MATSSSKRKRNEPSATPRKGASIPRAPQNLPSGKVESKSRRTLLDRGARPALEDRIKRNEDALPGENQKPRTTRLPKPAKAEMTATSISSMAKRPSHRAGYQRSNRTGMVGLGVEVPKELRDNVQLLAETLGMTKQALVTAVLNAAVTQSFQPNQSTLQLPDEFKEQAAAVKRAAALLIASVR